MLKYAYILNIEGLHPDTYTAEVFKTDTLTRYYGVDNMEETMEVVKKIKEEGFELINLCSAYDDEMTKEVEALIPRTKNVHYLPAEEEKLDKVEDWSKYGVISIDAQLDDIETTVIENPEFTTYAKIVKDIDAACVAAKELVEAGVTFIEMCSWFDEEKTKKVIEAIDCDVPVGSCGI